MTAPSSLIFGLVKVLFVNVCVDVSNTIEDVSDKSVDAIVISPDPSNELPAMFLAVANVVAVSALPVTFPVKLPSNADATKVPDVIVKSPVLAPVNVPVPTINLSLLSSKPINALS